MTKKVTTTELDKLLAEADSKNQAGEASGQVADPLDIAANSSAHRTTLTIDAGNEHCETLNWPSSSSGSGMSSRFHWKVIVHEEYTVDLEIRARLRFDLDGKTSDPGGTVTEVILQKHARGESFVGNFCPLRDRRIPRAIDAALAAMAPPATDASTPAAGETSGGNGKRVNPHPFQVEAILFGFSNKFSWLRAKNIEIITIFDDSSACSVPQR